MRDERSVKRGMEAGICKRIFRGMVEDYTAAGGLSEALKTI